MKQNATSCVDVQLPQHELHKKDGGQPVETMIQSKQHRAVYTLYLCYCSILIQQKPAAMKSSVVYMISEYKIF